MALAERLPTIRPSEHAIEPVPLDDALVARFKGGDRRAFDELVVRHQKGIYFLARRFVRDDDAAKDIAQRAFIKAFQGLNGLRGGCAFRAWLYRIAANLALNYLRDHARELRTPDAGTELPVDAVGTARIAAEEDQERLRDAIVKLPPKQRLVLELRIFDELPFKEIAEVAASSENAAKVNFHHAVKRLRELLAKGSGT